MKMGIIMRQNYLLKAIKKSPNNSLAYKYLGDLYEKNRDLVKALENWQFMLLKI